MSRSWRYFVNFYLFSLNCCHLFHVYVFFFVLFGWKIQMSAKYPRCYWVVPCRVWAMLGVKENEEKEMRETCIWGGHLPSFVALPFIHAIVRLLISRECEWRTEADTSQTQIAANATTNCTHTHQLSSFLSFYVRLFVSLLNAFNAFHAKCCTSATDFPGIWYQLPNKASKTHTIISMTR